MTTTKAVEALRKTKEALKGINTKLKPVLQKLRAKGFDKKKSEAKATVAMSVGMMRYMGARLRGLDQGRKPDDPLRKELNNMKKVLAEIKKKHSATKPKVLDNNKNNKSKEEKKDNNKKQKSANESEGTTQKMAAKETPVVQSKKRGTPDTGRKKNKRRKS